MIAGADVIAVPNSRKYRYWAFTDRSDRDRIIKRRKGCSGPSTSLNNNDVPLTQWKLFQLRGESLCRVCSRHEDLVPVQVFLLRSRESPAEVSPGL